MHEETKDLQPSTRDMDRALSSLIEELEAIAWYNQRADACDDDELRKILRHNSDEEKEHAAMLLEWILPADPFQQHGGVLLFLIAVVAQNFSQFVVITGIGPLVVPGYRLQFLNK